VDDGVEGDELALPPEGSPVDDGSPVDCTSSHQLAFIATTNSYFTTHLYLEIDDLDIVSPTVKTKENNYREHFVLN
jgi:hypothetical protein